MQLPHNDIGTNDLTRLDERTRIAELERQLRMVKRNFEHLAQQFPVATQNIDTMPQARIYRNAALSHSSTGNFQQVSLDGETLDEGTDTAQYDAANNQLVCRVAGLYSVLGAVRFSANATGRRIGALRVASGVTTLLESEASPVTASSVTCLLADERRFAVGDNLRLHAFQSSGGNLAYSVGESSVYLAWAWLSP
jgi:hypothetical protein